MSTDQPTSLWARLMNRAKESPALPAAVAPPQDPDATACPDWWRTATVHSRDGTSVRVDSFFSQCSS